MKAINELLKGFEWEDTFDFSLSLWPSLKYDVILMSISVSALVTHVDRLFGLDVFSLVALFAVMLVELASGTYASKITKTPFSSRKLSRFTLKMACYLVLIAVPYLFHLSFLSHHKSAAASLFDWMHTFLVTQIVIENIISILENLALIQGKSKNYWINKIKEKIKL